MLVCVLVVTDVASDVDTVVGGGNVVKGGGASVDEEDGVDVIEVEGVSDDEDVDENTENVVELVKRGIKE